MCEDGHDSAFPGMTAQAVNNKSSSPFRLPLFFSYFQAETQLDAESPGEPEDYGSPVDPKASMVFLLDLECLSTQSIKNTLFCFIFVAQDMELFDGPAVAAEVCETIRKIEKAASWSKHFNHQVRSPLGALHHCTSMRACLDEIATIACGPVTPFTAEEESAIQESLEVEGAGTLSKLWKTSEELRSLQDPKNIAKDRELMTQETTSENLEEQINAGFRTLDRIELGFQAKPWEEKRDGAETGHDGAETVSESAAITPTEVELTPPKPTDSQQGAKGEKLLEAKPKAKALAKSKCKTKALAKSKCKTKAAKSKQKKGSKDKKKRTKKDQKDCKMKRSKKDHQPGKKRKEKNDDEITVLKKKLHTALWWR